MLRCACCYPYISNPTYDSRCIPEPRTSNTLLICLAGEGSAEYLIFSRRRSQNAAMSAGMSSTATCMLAIRAGNPNDNDPWEWRCGFYPGSRPGECRTGTAASLDEARAGFEEAWKVFLAAWSRPTFRNGATSATVRRRTCRSRSRSRSCLGNSTSSKSRRSPLRLRGRPGASRNGGSGAFSAPLPAHLRRSDRFPAASISASSGLGDCAHANSRQHRLNGFGFRCPFGNRSPRPAQTVSAPLCSAARRRSIWGLRAPR
jgi:hypothetical protein